MSGVQVQMPCLYRLGLSTPGSELAGENSASLWEVKVSLRGPCELGKKLAAHESEYFPFDFPSPAINWECWR